MSKDILSRNETLIETPAFLIDIFPETVPQREDQSKISQYTAKIILLL